MSLSLLAHLPVSLVLPHMPINALPRLAFLITKLSIKVGTNEVGTRESVLNCSARIGNDAVHSRAEFLVGQKAKGIANIDDCTTVLGFYVLPLLSVGLEDLQSFVLTEQNCQTADVGVRTQTCMWTFC